MKVFASTLLLLIMAGCSSDDGSIVLSAENAITSEPYHKKNGAQSPANASNTYDYAGEIYFALLEEFYKLDHSAMTLQQVIVQGEALAFQNLAFQSLDGLETYEPIAAEAISPYQAIDGQAVSHHLSAGYSPKAKAIYSQLDNQLTLLKAKDAPYQEAHTALVEAEAIIAAEQDLSNEERSAMLTTASILRYALSHDGKRRRRDRDWEWMTGHVVATANASLQSVPEAIIVSFATDVY